MRLLERAHLSKPPNHAVQTRDDGALGQRNVPLFQKWEVVRPGLGQFAQQLQDIGQPEVAPSARQLLSELPGPRLNPIERLPRGDFPRGTCYALSS
jgi:hypothetical protein